MSKDIESFIPFESKERDETAEKLFLMLEKIDTELDDKVHSPTPLNLFVRMHNLRQRTPDASIRLNPRAEDYLEGGVFEYARVTYSRFIVDEVSQIYGAKLSESRFNITDGEYEDQLKDEVVRVFGENCDTKWLDISDQGRKMAILETLYEFSGKKPLGMYSQEQIEIMTFGRVEDFGTSYTLPTKFPEIKTEYYYPDGESFNPVISFVIDSQ